MKNTKNFRLFLLATLLLLGVVQSSRAQVNVSPALPNIPSAVYYVTNSTYGGVGDGITTNTAAVAAAIADASTLTGGGTIEFPFVSGSSNIYICGAIKLKNKMNLQVDPGVTLRMLYFRTWTNIVTGDFITAGSAPSDVAVSGGGTIDGQATLADWWAISGTGGKPYMINMSRGTRVWIHNVTLMRAPKMHIDVGGSASTDILIDGVTINTDSGDSHNTDGIDLTGHGILVQNCSITAGDDNIAVTANSANIVITNCAFGVGHGMSIGGTTGPGGVSNMMVINCTFNGTDSGIRIKSDNGTGGSSPVDGGLCVNLYYLNIGMTNVNNSAVMIYAYYDEIGTPTSITPATAAGEPVAVASTLTPIYQNIVISNLTATVAGSGIAGIIWGRTELPCTNILLSHVNITASKSFDVYNAYNVQFVDSQIKTTGSGQKTFELWNAGMVVTNTLLATNVISFDGMGGNTNSSLALYNVRTAETGTNLFGANPVTLSASVVTNTGNLTVSNNVAVNFALGTNNSVIAVLGNLNLKGTLNITNAAGFTATNYVLFTYTGALANTSTLGATPVLNNYTYSLDTSTAGQVQFVVIAPAPPSPPNFGNIQVAPDGSGNFVMSGGGGVTNGTYYVLASTNILLPLSQWTPIATNPFDASGNFSFTNTPDGGSPQTFYRLQLP